MFGWISLGLIGTCISFNMLKISLASIKALWNSLPSFCKKIEKFMTKDKEPTVKMHPLANIKDDTPKL